MAPNDCPFCGTAWYQGAEVVVTTPLCVYASTRDPRDPPEVLPGSGIVVPVEHRASPSDLTPEEWRDIGQLLPQVRAALHERLAPDGYTLGWNDFPRGEQGVHAHLHVVPRFDDEPLWDTGVRSAFKGPSNVRPAPFAPGTGRAMLR